MRRKGQAFIVYDNPESAGEAIELLQGFELFGKEMNLAFARTRSDVIVKRDGDDTEFGAHKTQRLALKEQKRVEFEAIEAQKKAEKEGAADSLKRGAPADETPAGMLKKPKTKTTAVPAALPDDFLQPNKTLFVQNLPAEADEDALRALFGRFPGLVDIRMFAARNVGFAEYTSEEEATVAKNNTNGTTMGPEQTPIRVTYQRQ